MGQSLDEAVLPSPVGDVELEVVNEVDQLLSGEQVQHRALRGHSAGMIDLSSGAANPSRSVSVRTDTGVEIRACPSDHETVQDFRELLTARRRRRLRRVGSPHRSCGTFLRV